MTEINPSKRNMRAEKEIAELDSKKEEYIRQRTSKQLEIDVIDSEISAIEAQIANIIMIKRRVKNEYKY